MTLLNVEDMFLVNGIWIYFDKLKVKNSILNA